MNIDERLEALTHTVELLAAMQIKTEQNFQALQERQQTTADELRRLTHEVRLFRHFVLSMGATFESRLIKLEYPPEPETGESPAA